MDRVKVIVRNAGIVARRYKGVCWWSSEEDTRQAAIVEQLKSLRTYDPSRCFIRFSWKVAVNAASASVKTAGSPVSGGEPDRLIPFHRAAVELLDDHPSEDCSPSDVFFQKDLAERIRSRIEDLLGEDGVLFAIDLLTGEFYPSDVAAEHDVPVAYVYQCVRKIRNVLISDPELYTMWKESICPDS